METNPYSQSNEVTDQVAEVKMATELINQNINLGADKFQKVLEIIFGENSKKYGLTSNNLKLLFMFVGVYVSTPYIKDFLMGNEQKNKKPHWKQTLLTLALILAVRKSMENNSISSNTHS